MTRRVVIVAVLFLMAVLLVAAPFALFGADQHAKKLTAEQRIVVLESKLAEMDASINELGDALNANSHVLDERTLDLNDRLKLLEAKPDPDHTARR